MEEAVGSGMGILIAVLIMVVMGGIIGWLAGLIVKGSGYGLLGDVIIGYEQAARQAAELGHSTQEELTLIVLHGFLHLLGHDDEEPSARHVMWQRQSALLEAVGLAHIAPAE